MGQKKGGRENREAEGERKMQGGYRRQAKEKKKKHEKNANRTKSYEEPIIYFFTLGAPNTLRDCERTSKEAAVRDPL